MNTFIWGPPLWRLIHSVAFCAKHEHADAVSQFFLSFKQVLPCIYCRKSFAEFEEILKARYGNRQLSQIIRDQELFTWSYALHDLVNEKLDQQEFEKQIVTKECLRAKQLSFQCLEKRHLLHPVHVTVTDLFDILFIFALNYPEDETDKELGTKREAYKQFLLTFPYVVHILVKNGDPLIRISQDPLFKFAKHYQLLSLTPADKLRRNVLETRKNLFCSILIIWASYYKHDVSTPQAARTLYENMINRYSVVKAKACKHGTCF
jgi:hypothetical protein